MSKKRERQDVSVKLDDSLMQSMAICKVFDNPFRARVNSIDFHREEDLMLREDYTVQVAASDDDGIHLFDTNRGHHLKSAVSKKYGCRSATYTHHKSCVLVASVKGYNHSIRYLSFHDNRWLRFFDGHSDRVTSISMSPSNDTFLSAGEDQEVRLWDLRSVNCTAMVRCPGLPCCAFDQQGLVFAVSSNCGVIKLFDVRGYDKGPFVTFAVKEENCSVVPFSSLKFSFDGQKIIAVNQGNVYVVEAFEGHLLVRLSTGVAAGSISPEASFTPTGEHVAACCGDHKLRIWNIENASSAQKSNLPISEAAVLSGHTSELHWPEIVVIFGLDDVTCVKWAPKRALMASACHSLAFWLPRENSKASKSQRPRT